MEILDSIPKTKGEESIQVKLSKASVFRAQNKLEEDEQIIERCLKKYPKHPEVIIAKANLLAIKGDNEEAIDMVKKAIPSMKPIVCVNQGFLL